MQTLNPFLPVREYIADGEPHVFGDRVYLFGSHDKEAADTYCALDYEFYSAPINDLSNWTSKGINYRATQDPLCEKTNRKYMYAPDVVRGNDGKYYLYYSLSGEKGHGGYHGPISVAVCDTPDGQYEYVGYLKYPNGEMYNEYVCFDPAVINDNGTIRLYYGTLYPMYGRPHQDRFTTEQMDMFNKTKEEVERGVMGPIHVELMDDMVTVKTKPVRILPVDRTEGDFFGIDAPEGWYGHYRYGKMFFEGSSIRKINGLYYFIYSSMNNHELCYATSKYPDRDFTFRGTIISNGDIGYKGRSEEDRLNHTATTHGSVECIDGNWYVFYHRQTHGTDYSRQAMAEPIKILGNGDIPQVEMTSMSFYAKPLKKGKYSAIHACNITNGRMPHGSNASFDNLPGITSDGVDSFVRLFDDAYAGYKYFDLTDANEIILTIKGSGEIAIISDNDVCDTVKIDSKEKTTKKARISGGGKAYLQIKANSGTIDLYEFEVK